MSFVATGEVRAPGSLGLPHEILQDIFQSYHDVYNANENAAYYCARLDPLRVQYVWNKPPLGAPPWLFAIPHTCSLWRMVSLQLPSLWPSVCLEWLEPLISWVAVRNRRTGLRLLRLDGAGDFAVPQALLDRALFIDRIDAPKTPVSALIPLLETSAAYAASSLHTLHMLGLPVIVSASAPSTALLPASLHHLCVTLSRSEGAALPPLPELLSLSIFGGHLRNMGHTASACLSAIKRLCPKLTRLDISFCAIPVGPRSHKVHFRHLKEFCFRGSVDVEAAALLSSIDLPSECCAFVSCSIMRVRELSWTDTLLPAISSFTSAYRDQSVFAGGQGVGWLAATLSLRRSSEGEAKVHPCAQHSDRVGHGPPLHLGVPVPYTDGNTAAGAVRALIDLLPISTLETLKICSPPSDVVREFTLRGDQIVSLDEVERIVASQRGVRHVSFVVTRWEPRAV